MPFSVKRRPRRLWRVVLPWLVGALPMACGLLIMHWQAERELQSRSEASTRQVVRQIDHILDDISAAAQALLPLAGQPCAAQSLALREQVVRHAFVRSTNLEYRGELYCSSLFGTYREVIDSNDYFQGRLWLMQGNSVTPGHPLLAYRTAADGRGAISTADGDHLIGALHLLDDDTRLILQVGPNWMGQSGEVHTGPRPVPQVAVSELSSLHYPFSILGGYDQGKVGKVMRSEYPALFGLLILLGAMAAVTCYWQLRRASSPRAELQRAIEADEFVPYFQPVVRQNDYGWAGVEVLMRWQHPREGLVSPDLFIPYAEHSGQIVPMTRRLLERTAQTLAPHVESMGSDFHIAINITADHCQDLALLDDCRAFLAAFPANSVRLTLELTERKLISPTELTHTLFAGLHELGVLIALDDFGTGQSSLAYLQQFQVDYLKIDQSFVAMIGGDALSLHILESIIELSSKLGLGIVAEGVETEAQRDYLARHNVDFQQGYLFARPMSADVFIQALQAQCLTSPPGQPMYAGDG
ncbi:EAL domain-containing protein [Pseudomonas sp. H9]|uniref:EAL domain-containing protein n=1 Tax=Pseudomonas sp. H9 TaxID=483968 RepID=UPI001057AC3E|nr:EAL domain-containing protein [Pseudomonas sp. H9]TDF82429.1 cyclic diguanylate phosphodiesterase [Pseudomonas sp. H9]